MRPRRNGNADQVALRLQPDAELRLDAVADLAREIEQFGRGGAAPVRQSEGVFRRDRDRAGQAVPATEACVLDQPRG